MVREHGTDAGVYAHASVGCLHVRPVVNLKTEAGVRQFEAIASASADLVLRVRRRAVGRARRRPGPQLRSWRRCSGRCSTRRSATSSGPSIRTASSIPARSSTRRRSRRTCATARRTERRSPPTFFDYSEYRRPARARSRCAAASARAARRSTARCARRYMATREEAHSTRGRANVLRLAMAGQLGDAGLGRRGRARGARPVPRVPGVQGRVSGRRGRRRGSRASFLPATGAGTARRCARACSGTSIRCRAWGSRFAPLSNVVARSAPVRWLNERLLGLDRRRLPPAWASDTFARQFRRRRRATAPRERRRGALQRHVHQLLPSRGRHGGLDVLERLGIRA